MDKMYVSIHYALHKFIYNLYTVQCNETLQFPALSNKNLAVIEETACKGMQRQDKQDKIRYDRD